MSEPLKAVPDAGILTLGVGPDYGGRTVPASELSRVLPALGRGDPSAALLSAMAIFQHLQRGRLRKWPDTLYRKVARPPQPLSR